MSVDANVIAKACRQRRKTHSRSRLHRQSDHYQRWLNSRGVRVEIEKVPNWEPPEYHFFYKVLGPKSLPKVGGKVGLTLVPALLAVRQGQVYITKETGYLKLVARPNIIKPLHSLDGEKWYSIVATVTARQKQDLELPVSYIERMHYYPGTGDRIRFVYGPNDQAGAIQSYSEGAYGKAIKGFTAPYYHFDNCIECQNETHQIGYIIADGPHFATIDHLEQHPDEIAGQILDYRIDKVVCAKTGNELITATSQSFLLKVEILSINAEKDLLPDYRMVIGRVRGYTKPKLYPDEPEFTAKIDAESDSNLFATGTYIYIDHYINSDRQSKGKISNPYSDDSESGQICYIIGPETPEFGSCPIRPFS